MPVIEPIEIPRTRSKIPKIENMIDIFVTRERGIGFIFNVPP